jgi:hypothetical protein
MELISNSSEVSPLEYSQWSNEVAKTDDEELVPTEAQIEDKEREIANIHNFVYDDVSQHFIMLTRLGSY